jgi:hypothetical protein
VSWFKLKAQPKDERPPLQGYGDNLQGSEGEDGYFWCECGELVKEGNVHICLDPLLSLPRPRVDPDLIGDYYQ